MGVALGGTGVLATVGGLVTVGDLVTAGGLVVAVVVAGRTVAAAVGDIVAGGGVAVTTWTMDVAVGAIDGLQANVATTNKTTATSQIGLRVMCPPSV